MDAKRVFSATAKSFVSLSVALVANWYFLELLGRTQLGARSTMIGQDVVWIMWGTCAVAVLIAVVLMFDRALSARRKTLALLLALLPTIGFFVLVSTGLVVGLTDASWRAINSP